MLRCKDYVKHRCPSTVVTHADRVVKEPNEHNHSDDAINNTVQKLRTDIRSASSTTRSPTRQVLGAAMTSVKSPDVLSRLPLKSVLEKSIRRKR